MAQPEQLRTVANQLNDAARHVEMGQTSSFNWVGLIALLVQLVPQILHLFQAPQPAVSPVPTGAAPTRAAVATAHAEKAAEPKSHK
jgi:hypothetical protein